MKIKKILIEIFSCLKNEKANDTSTKLVVSLLIVFILNYLFKLLCDLNNVDSFDMIKSFFVNSPKNHYILYNDYKTTPLYLKFQAFKLYCMLTLSFFTIFIMIIPVKKNEKSKIYKISLIISCPILVYKYVISSTVEGKDWEILSFYINFLWMNFFFLYICLFTNKIVYRFLFFIISDIIILYMGPYLFIAPYFISYLILCFFIYNICSEIKNILIKNGNFIKIFNVSDYVKMKVKNIIEGIINKTILIFFVFFICVIVINVLTIFSHQEMLLFFNILFFNNKIYQESMILMLFLAVFSIALYYLFIIMQDNKIKKSNLTNEYLLFILSVALLEPNYFNCCFVISPLVCYLIKHMDFYIKSITSYVYDLIIIIVIYYICKSFIPNFMNFM